MSFYILLFLFGLVAGLDLCHDPRSRELNRSCATPSFAVTIPSVHGNPFHALHDTLWAVSHYFRNCVKHPLTLYVGTEQNLALCEQPEAEPQPDWGFCVAYILTKAVGGKIDTRFRGTEDIGRGDVCHTTEIVLRQKIEGWPETFRGLNWFVDYGDGLGHVRLDSDESAKAFRHIRSTVRRFYGLHKNEKAGDGNKINVLIYDRSDARRRNWVNAGEVVKMVQKVADVNMTYIKYIPPGLGKQVALFGKADLLIAPHGAAMSNTLFMRQGGAVVEIVKECEQKDWIKRKGSEWTGWHADLVGLKLEYVGCRSGNSSMHRADTKEIEMVSLRMLEEIRERRLGRRGRVKKKKIGTEKVMMGAMMPVVGAAVLSLVRYQRMFGTRLLMRGKSKIGVEGNNLIKSKSST